MVGEWVNGSLNGGRVGSEKIEDSRRDVSV